MQERAKASDEETQLIQLERPEPAETGVDPRLSLACLRTLSFMWTMMAAQ